MATDMGIEIISPFIEIIVSSLKLIIAESINSFWHSDTPCGDIVLNRQWGRQATLPETMSIKDK